tara:strand:+ start:95 stop:292 length:198 start_codon:yes stop_codon:yes gene_type:complete
MNRIGESSDFISDCGNFKICASNEIDGAYMPLMRSGDMQDLPITFVRLTKGFVSWELAEEILSIY